MTQALRAPLRFVQVLAAPGKVGQAELIVEILSAITDGIGEGGPLLKEYKMLVAPERFELPTHGLGNRCSIP